MDEIILEAQSRKYVIIDKTSGLASQVMQWGDNRDFPFEFITIQENEEVITVLGETIKVGDVYDYATGLFYILEPGEPVPPEPTEVEVLQGQLAEMQEALLVAQGAIDFIVMNF